MKGDIPYNKKKRLRPETLLERLERYRTGVDQRPPIITARIFAKADTFPPDKIEELIRFVAKENNVPTENVYFVINESQCDRDLIVRRVKSNIKR